MVVRVVALEARPATAEVETAAEMAAEH